ncbi:MAG: hypothetical protein ABEK17_01960 [Candidatus Aenigmatarchaeota archaeon]
MDDSEEIVRYVNRSLGRRAADLWTRMKDLEENQNERERFGDFVDSEMEMNKFKDYVEETSLLGKFFTYLTQELPSFVYERGSER